MKFKFKDVATSMATVVFLVVAVSGLMLYFKIFNSQVKELHEILGLAFVAAAVLHVTANWKAMKNYFTKKIFISAALVVVVISGLFISQNLDKGADPKGTALRSIINAPLDASLKVLAVDYDEAMMRLENANIKNLNKKSLGEIAKANGDSPFKIIAIITSK
ncbi:DUF4405 domain-containing protein [Halarcobacter sp.]|uniref:DUF4405 domain-containing protein n=1 Tax=Halarcobacter sp. TaxID=2321133 RepID=UPI002AA8A8F0|nr:DUF4405 domain-containing protein [Halarcobacter sp.]